MHPITVIEIIVSTIFIIIIFATALLLPKKIRKLSLIIASSITVILFSFFAIRPYWVDYQVSKKTEQLNHYLEEKYPNRKISRNIGREDNPYHLNVEFVNEKGWTYDYSLVNGNNIYQNGWTTPEGKRPTEGNHFE